MAKIHLIKDAMAVAVRPELDGVTPIVPLRAVALHLAVQTTDELAPPVPRGRTMRSGITGRTSRVADIASRALGCCAGIGKGSVDMVRLRHPGS